MKFDSIITQTWLIVFIIGVAVAKPEADSSQPVDAKNLEVRADSLFEAKEYDMALTDYRILHSFYQTAYQKARLAHILFRLGKCYYYTYDYANALSSYIPALDLYKKLGDKHNQCETLKSLAATHYQLNNLDEGIEVGKECLKLSKKTKQLDLQLTINNTIGSLYMMKSEYKKALKFLNNSLVLCEKTKNIKEELKVHLNIAYCLGSMGEVEEELDCLRYALSLADKEDNKYYQSKILTNIGVIHFNNAEYENAIKYYNASLAIQDVIGDKVNMAFLNYSLGNVYLHKSDYLKAQEYTFISLQQFREINNTRREKDVLHNLGRIYLALSNYPKALESYSECLELCRKLGDYKYEAHTLGDMGIIYIRLDNLDKALAFLREALDIYENAEDKGGIAFSLGNIASIYNYQGKYQDALNLSESTLKIQIGLGNRLGECDALGTIGHTYINLKRYDDAIIALQKSIKISQELDDVRRESWLLHMVGYTHFLNEKFSEGLSLAEEAIELAEKHGITGDVDKYAYHLIGRCHEKLGNDELAIEFFDKAISTTEEIRGSLEYVSHKRNYIESHIDFYDDMIRVLHRNGRHDDAFKYSELSRARAFLDMLAEGNVEGGDDFRSAEVLEFTSAIIPESQPDQLSLNAAKSLAVSEIQALIKQDETLLQYYQTDNFLIIWMCTNSLLKNYLIDISRESLSELVINYRETIQVLGNTKFVSDTLYRTLIEPLEDDIRTEKLTIVPHGILHYLPFHTLDDFDQYCIRYLPSASTLKYLPEKSTRVERNILVVSNPIVESDGNTELQFADSAAQNIASYFDNSVVLTGRNASEVNFRNISSEYDILHLACHARLDATSPMSSGLMLASTPGDDGILEVHEVFALELNSSLVVLSACETALGRLSDADELTGLSRAFIHAGAPSLISSLWKVEDEATSCFMKYFYEYLTYNTTSEALRLAQIATRENFPEPFYWAPFILTGAGL